MEVFVIFPLDILDAQIARMNGLVFRMLSFPAALETYFETSTAVERCRRFGLEGLVATLIFDLALTSEQLFIHDRSLRGFLWLLGSTTFAALLINASMLFRPQPVLRETSVALFACLLACTDFMLSGGHSAVESAYAQFTMVGIAVFTNAVMRLRFPYAVATYLLMTAEEVIFIQHDRILTTDGKLLGLALTLSVLSLTLVSNYSQNRAERVSFLLCLRGDVLIEKLSEVNRDLAVAAETDRLTSLANRYAFDLRFAEVWKRAKDEGAVVSLILVDIDHFKRLNDHYGHLYGDKVLTRVALLLCEALRKKDDLAARFGGEEFVILLPRTTRDAALNVAERLRMLIELAGFPATEAPDGALTGVHATISCGVASVSPLVCPEPQQLILAADQALYRAKELGRNMVSLAEWPLATGALASAH